MTQSGITLPFRLVPRKRSQIMPLFAFCFAFIIVSLMTLVTASKPTIRINDVEVSDPLVRILFVLLGLAGVLFCIGGIVAVAVKMLPRSPFFHIVRINRGPP